jgi:hypothetical protein
METKIYKANWYRQNRERILAERKAYHRKNAVRIRARVKKWREDNRQRYLLSLADWRLRNKSRAHEQQRVCKAAQRKRDPLYRLELRLRWRLWSVVRGIKGYTQKTRELLGCSLAELKSWLESQFQPGMSWSNYGLWHIDHKIPCAAFDFSNESEQKACFHYTNLQPLWARENASKGSKGQYRGKSQSRKSDPVETKRWDESQDIVRSAWQHAEPSRNVLAGCVSN